MSDLIYERFFALLLAAIGAYAFFTSMSFQSPTYPAALGAILCICSLIMLFRAFRGKDKDKRKEAVRNIRITREQINVIVTIVLSFLYVVLLNPLGFVIDSILFMSVLMLMLGYRRIWIIFSVSIPLSFVLYFFFTKAIHIGLPPGLLPF